VTLKHDICDKFCPLRDPVISHGSKQIPKEGIEMLRKSTKDARTVLIGWLPRESLSTFGVFSPGKGILLIIAVEVVQLAGKPVMTAKWDLGSPSLLGHAPGTLRGCLRLSE
jgi:hypothetical protein